MDDLTKSNISESSHIYFGNLMGDDLLSELKTRIDNYYEYIKSFKLFAVWNKTYNTYYGRDRDGFTTAEIGRGGTQGELSILKANHFRNLIQHLIIMVTGQRPHLDCRAANTDYKSQAQTILGKAILECYNRGLKVDQLMVQAIEYAWLFGEGFLFPYWDADAGDPYSKHPETEKVIYKGDAKVKVYAPHDVIRDINTSDNSRLDHWIIRDFENKYNVAAQHPEFEEKILNSSTSLIDDINIRFHYTKSSTETKDMITVYRLVHKKTPALPQGREVKFLNGDAILSDTPLRYKKENIIRVCPAEYIGSPFGYSVAYDLLAVQDTVDAMYSTIATNALTFGVQSVSVLEGSNISVKKISDGLNLFTYSKVGGEPKPLNLTATPPEIFNFLATLEKLQETLANVSSVNRGNADSGRQSGAALALLASQAIQFNSGMQSSYASAIEELGTFILELLQEFASVPRMIEITGDFNKSYMQEFKGSDISEVSRVYVDLGNPMMRSLAGRQATADALLNQGQLTAKQYLNILSTGELETGTESREKETMLIKTENESIAKGISPTTLADDNHQQHILEHRCVVADPEARKVPNVLRAYITHQNEHLAWLANADPRLLMISGQQQIPPNPQQDIAALQGRQNPMAPKGANPEQPAMDVMGGQQVNIQQMAPQNPQTGKQYDINKGA